MKLITDNTRYIAATPHDRRCMEIVARHGDFAAFQGKYCPANMLEIVQSLNHYTDAPSLVMLLKTYGSANIVKNLSLFLVAVVKNLKLDSVEFADINTIATLMTQNDTARRLKYPYIVEFFVKVMQGEYNVYAFKPHQVMRAFKEYSAQALHSQALMLETEERRKEALESEGKVTLSWSELAARRGIDEASPIEELVKNMEQ